MTSDTTQDPVEILITCLSSISSFDDDTTAFAIKLILDLTEIGVNHSDATYAVLKTLGISEKVARDLRDAIDQCVDQITTPDAWNDLHTANATLFLINSMEMSQDDALALAMIMVPRTISTADYNVLSAGIYMFPTDIILDIKNNVSLETIPEYTGAWIGIGNETLIALSDQPETLMSGVPTIGDVFQIGAALGANEYEFHVDTDEIVLATSTSNPEQSYLIVRG